MSATSIPCLQRSCGVCGQPIRADRGFTIRHICLHSPWWHHSCHPKQSLHRIFWKTFNDKLISLQTDQKLSVISCLEMVKKNKTSLPCFPSPVTTSLQWDSAADRKLKTGLIFPASPLFKMNLS